MPTNKELEQRLNKQDKKFAQQEENMNDILDILKEIKGKVDSNEPVKIDPSSKDNTAIPPRDLSEPVISPVNIVEPPEDVSLSMSMPPGLRKIIDKVLGKEFEAELVASGMNFQLRVYMPEHYDRRTGDEKTQLPDMSGGLIRRENPDADTEHWCHKIGDNIQKQFPTFKPEYQFLKHINIK